MEGVNGEERRSTALLALDALAEDDVLVPAQAQGELFAVLTRKTGRGATIRNPFLTPAA